MIEGVVKSMEFSPEPASHKKDASKLKKLVTPQASGYFMSLPHSPFNQGTANASTNHITFSQDLSSNPATNRGNELHTSF